MKRYQQDPNTPVHLRRLLDSARGDELDASRRRRVALRMGIGAPGLLALDAGSTSSSGWPRVRLPFGGTGARTLVIVGVGLGIAGVMSSVMSRATVASQGTSSSMPISAPSPVHVEPATAPAETSAVPAMSVTALPNVEVAAPDVRAARTATVAAPRAAAPATEVADLRAELLALDAVRAATDDGRPRKALALLDGYASKYKTGKLREEASVLRIEALAAAGERESARRLADRFLRESPTTIYTARVRAAVARVPSPEQP